MKSIKQQIKLFKNIKLNDKQATKLLEQFANDTSVAKGGNIKVVKTEHTIEFIPRDSIGYMKIEDTAVLHELIRGAEHFLYWIRRGQK